MASVSGGSEALLPQIPEDGKEGKCGGREVLGGAYMEQPVLPVLLIQARLSMI